MGKQILQPGDVIKIPAEVAVCPICGSALVARPSWPCNLGCSWAGCPCHTGWLLVKGQWQIESCNIDCETGPDIEDEQWWPWAAGHYSQPYIDWLPVEKKVVDWINENYRFEVT